MPGIETGSNLLPLGRTYYDGRTIDTANYGNSVDYEGQPATYRNIVAASSGQTLVLPLNSGAIIGRVVRNVSGIALLPGRIAVYQWSRDEAGRECWRFLHIQNTRVIT